MSRRLPFSVFIWMVLAAPPAPAQIPHGRWEKMEALRPGTRILILLDAGDRIEGTLTGLYGDMVIITEGNNQERRIAKPMIRRIVTASGTRDRLRNGAWIGAGVGAAAGLIAMIAFANAKTEGRVYWGDEDGPGYLISAGLVGAGIGAATGAIIDASLKHHELLYHSR